MVLLTINTIGLLYITHYTGAGRLPGGASPVQVGGDYTNAGPTFSTTIQKWKADPDFTPLTATEFLKPKTQAKWESLIPAGSDFGADGKVSNTTSVTHQIHCVIFSSVLSNSTEIGIPSDYKAHFLHCVDYMRQAAMCAGDVAIEPRDEDGKPGGCDAGERLQRVPRIMLTGRDFVHPLVCKNYDQVKNYLEEQVKEGVRHILPIDD
ncbi:uncharacterized protein PG986_005103 [Apiospora aurea]|uniref:Uncharacterized protein n=1 Tax=Apiospora aurea TaxID=335848 RepID=A0ABR1QGK8_9PEZI